LNCACSVVFGMILARPSAALKVRTVMAEMSSSRNGAESRVAAIAPCVQRQQDMPVSPSLGARRPCHGERWTARVQTRVRVSDATADYG
jgi:hypothetical protein